MDKRFLIWWIIKSFIWDKGINKGLFGVDVFMEYKYRIRVENKDYFNNLGEWWWGVF